MNVLKKIFRNKSNQKKEINFPITIHKNILENNKKKSENPITCIYRNYMYNFVNEIIKDLRFSLNVCNKYWKKNVIYKTLNLEHYIKNPIIINEKVLIEEFVKESNIIYNDCLNYNPLIETFLFNSIFLFGVPNKIIIIMFKIFNETILSIDKKIFKKNNFAISISQYNKNIYIVLSNILYYYDFLITIYNIESKNFEKNLKINIDEITRENILADTYIGDYTFESKKYKIYLIFNKSYRNKKFDKLSENISNKNFIPFKRFENRVNCNNGSLCVEPLYVNWLFQKKKITYYDNYKSNFGVFYFKNNKNEETFNNKNLIGTNDNDSVKNKLYERVVIGYLLEYLDDKEFVIDNLKYIRKLMTPCPGCFMNAKFIKNNKFEKWNISDCDKDCSTYNLS